MSSSPSTDSIKIMFEQIAFCPLGGPTTPGDSSLELLLAKDVKKNFFFLHQEKEIFRTFYPIDRVSLIGEMIDQGAYSLIGRIRIEINLPISTKVEYIWLDESKLNELELKELKNERETLNNHDFLQYYK